MFPTTMDFKSLSDRYQQFIKINNSDFSYEKRIDSKSQVSCLYDIIVAIPTAKKCILWFTFVGQNYICVLFDHNPRNKQSSIVNIVNIESSDYEVYFGTVLYGSLYEHRVNGSILGTYFMFEDTPMFKGQSTKGLWYREKLVLFRELVQTITNTYVPLMLPVMWNRSSKPNKFDMAPVKEIFYKIHHCQYRSLGSSVSPVIVPCGKLIDKHMNGELFITKTSPLDQLQNRMMSKPYYQDMNQTHSMNIFSVTADLQNDVYHLVKDGVRYVAFIPDLKTSKMMNNLFRKLKENECIDKIEESDDEEEFQDTRMDRFVDLEKHLTMECIWNTKFNQWTPLRVIE